MIQESIPNSLKRVKKDLQDGRLHNLNDNSAICQIKVTNEIIVSITPLEGAFKFNNYVFQLNFPAEYPFQPPEIKVESWINHPNIDLKQKLLYLNILNAYVWKPTLGLYDILMEMKKTIVNIDLSYIPNTIDCIKSAQRLGKQDHSTDEEEIEEVMEFNQNFRANFELDPIEQFIMERESADDTDEDHQQKTDQLPVVLDLKKKAKYFLEDGLNCN